LKEENDTVTRQEYMWVPMEEGQKGFMAKILLSPVVINKKCFLSSQWKGER
jgi:hypothetical protein